MRAMTLAVISIGALTLAACSGGEADKSEAAPDAGVDATATTPTAETQPMPTPTNDPAPPATGDPAGTPQPPPTLPEEPGMDPSNPATQPPVQ